MSASAELVDSTDVDRQVRAVHRVVAAIVGDLEAIARRLEHDGNLLESNSRKWRERLSFLESQQVPAPVLARARSIDAKVQGAYARVREYRDGVLLALDRALALRARVDDARALVAAQQERARSRRTQMERSSLLQLLAAPAQLDLVAVELGVAWRVLRDYWLREAPRITGLFFGALVLSPGSSCGGPRRRPNPFSAPTVDRLRHRFSSH